jgi:molybdopterin converting factor small subunit
MAIRVRLPAMLRDIAGDEIVVDEPVHDLAAVRAVLEHRFPALAARLSDPIFNVAINDVMLLHRVSQHPVADGDVIEIIPTVAGG